MLPITPNLTLLVTAQGKMLLRDIAKKTTEEMSSPG